MVQDEISEIQNALQSLLYHVTRFLTGTYVIDEEGVNWRNLPKIIMIIFHKELRDVKFHKKSSFSPTARFKYFSIFGTDELSLPALWLQSDEIQINIILYHCR
jgi:hypothetical protein